MARPDFWDNQEKAQKTIAALKPLNGLLKPFKKSSNPPTILGL